MANLTGNDIQDIGNGPTITGTEEADLINVNSTAIDVSINAKSGDDVILLNFGNHTVDGGNGDDYVDLYQVFPFGLSNYNNTNNIISFQVNDNTYRFTSVETIAFTYVTAGGALTAIETETIALPSSIIDAAYNSGNQLQNGTFENNEIAGSSENDSIDAQAGNDIVHGGNGNDIIFGNDGDDTLYGNEGDDALLGGKGNDIIIASGIEGQLNSNGGNDFIDGGEGEDTLYFEESLYGLNDYSNDNGKITITTLWGGTNTVTNIEHIDFQGLKLSIDFYNAAFNTDAQSLSGTDSDNFIWGGLNDDIIMGLAGNDTIEARDGNDTVYGGDGDDIISGVEIAYGGDDNDTISGTGQLYGEAGNDSITAQGNSSVDGGVGDDLIFVQSGDYVIEGGEGNDVVYIPFGSQGPFPDIFGDPIALQNISKQKNGGYLITTDAGSYAINNVETIAFSAYRGRDFHTPEELLSEKTIPTVKVNGSDINPNAYQGPVSYLDYEFIGESTDDIIVGSLSNDFFNLKDGDDAAEGGIGDDVLDGGAGSNFLTGGQGSDTFFLDGRDGETTWSTITDFNGDEVNIWGWNDGVSKLLSSEDNAGADGFKGATLHYDLNNDGTIDTSITFSGLALSETPQSIARVIEDNGYLFFG